MSLRTSIDLKLDPPAAFAALVGELSMALADLGMQLEAGDMAGSWKGIRKWAV